MHTCVEDCHFFFPPDPDQLASSVGAGGKEFDDRDAVVPTDGAGFGHEKRVVVHLSDRPAHAPAQKIARSMMAWLIRSVMDGAPF